MNTSLQAFAFDSHAVRVVMKGDTPWFVAKDVANCLGIQNHRQMVSRLDGDERDGVCITDAIGREQQTTIINESGLYAIILRADGAMVPGTPAHTFRKWVTAEVLPAIRKTGSYAAPGAADAHLEQLLIRVDRLCDIVEKLIETLPALTRPARRPRKKMFEADLAVIAALRATGAKLEDIMRLTGFSQTQVWCACVGRYTVHPGGRVVVDPKSPAALSAQEEVRHV